MLHKGACQTWDLDSPPIKLRFILLLAQCCLLGKFSYGALPSWNLWGSTYLESLRFLEVTPVCPSCKVLTVQGTKASVGAGPPQILFTDSGFSTPSISLIRCTRRVQCATKTHVCKRAARYGHGLSSCSCEVLSPRHTHWSRHRHMLAALIR
jgi:hypothetical protein